jgi:hypothetical protein
LYIRLESTGFSGAEVTDIQLADTDWSGGTLTWNNAPASDGDIGDISVVDIGWKSVDILTTIQDWFDGDISNYGVRLELNIPDVNKTAKFSSNESDYKPYLLVTYTLSEDLIAIVKDAAWDYLYQWHIPILRYSARYADLSKAIIGTWKNETIAIGDTVRMYDAELGLNNDVRVKKITEDMINPLNNYLELSNKVIDITNSQALIEKKLSYAMPFNNNPRVIDAGAIQKGSIGGEVG